jgi:8-oxo-dGTP diphosphatase
MASYPLLSISVEGIVFVYVQKQFRVLLQLHEEKPFRDKWGLPFHLVKENESLEKSTEKLRQKLNKFSLGSGIQSSIYSDPKRHPKTRMVSFATVFFAKQNVADFTSPSYKWVSPYELPELIMDHAMQIKEALSFLKSLTDNQTFVFDLLPERFTLTELQECLEYIYGMPLDKRNFRKKILSYGILKPTREKQKGVAHKAATFYTVDKKKLEKLHASL